MITLERVLEIASELAISNKLNITVEGNVYNNEEFLEEESSLLKWAIIRESMK